MARGFYYNTCHLFQHFYIQVVDVDLIVTKPIFSTFLQAL